jgi:VWFA-related protein
MTADNACRIVFVALLCVAVEAGRAQQNVVIQTETRVVLVDAIVTAKKGEFVRDLTAKDFRVWQDGKEQTIKSLSLEEESTGPHYLVLYFDNTSMTTRDQVMARQAASGFIDANAGPNRLMAVLNYAGTLRVAQNFTDNAGRLKDALNRAGSSAAAPSASDIDRSHEPGLERQDRLTGGGTGGNTSATTSLGVRDMIRSLGNLTKSLGVLPGRKIVVLLSGVLPSSSEQQSEVRAVVEASNKSGVAIYPIDVRPVSTEMGSAPFRPAPPPNFSRGGQGPQGQTDDSGLDAQDTGATSQQLQLALANGTGGFAIQNSSQLLEGLQKIGEEQGEYYVLSYSPPESKEGSCHALRVKVDRSGTTVRARTKYCASRPQDLLAGTSAGKDLESRAAGAQPGSLAASMQLPYFYLSPNVARVNLAMEIAPDALKFENEKGRLHAEINLLGIATTAEGGVGARFSDVLKLDFDNQAQIEKLKVTPLHYEKEFKIAPGEYRFTLAFSSGGASFGKLEGPLAVEPRKAGELALSSVALSREAHPAADLGLASSLIEDRTPLTADGVQVVPSGSGQFTKSEAAFFYFEVYDPNPASVGVQVRVLDRKTGEPKTNSASMKLDLAKSSSNSAIPSGSRLPIDSLAAGAYQLEVMAIDSAGQQVKRTANFEIK